MIKKRILAALALSIFVVSALFISPTNAYLETSQTIQSSGMIVSNQNTADLNVFLRCLTLTTINPNQDLTKYVDNFVGNYTFGKKMTIELSDLGIDGILQYPNCFNQSAGAWPTGTGWTWTNIKTLIDAFHAHGWKVWWTGTAVAWNNQWLYNYISQQHPELAFTDSQGYRANGAAAAEPSGNTAGNKGVGYNCLIPDFWARYSTPDTQLGIASNARLIDVITTKLGQIISSGLRFDGWAGADGWNGFNMQGYNFQNAIPSCYYSFSYQEENEWASDVQSGFGLSTIGKTAEWDNWNITQRASWINSNSTAKQVWYEWWCYRFSDMYLQIKNTIGNSNPGQEIYSIMGADSSSQWTSGNLGGAGILNFTMFAEKGAVDIFVVDPENTQSSPKYIDMAKTDSWVASLVKGKDARLNCGVGIQVTSYGDGAIAVPEWSLKQQYLAQVQNYVWYNGLRYPASERNIIFLQFVPNSIPGNVNWATTSWNNTAVHDFFNWANVVNELLTQATPVYLGPMKVNGYYLWGGDAINGISYTFAQFADENNLQKSTSYISSQMGTLFLEQSDFMGTPFPSSFQDAILSMYANNTLNFIVGNARGTGPGGGSISTLFTGGNESKIASALALNYSAGSKDQMASVLNQNQIKDATGRWITNGFDSSTSWTCANPTYAYCYANLNGFTPLINSVDNRVAMGMAHGTDTSNFLYMCLYSRGFTGSPSFGITMPREIVNRAIYWASNSPINVSNALVDYKIFRTNSTIIIPFMNDNAADLTAGKTEVSTTANLSGLSLGSPANYSVTWASSPQQELPVTDWASINITLENNADMLIISEK